jgi:hypothetical protein
LVLRSRIRERYPGTMAIAASIPVNTRFQEAAV